MSLNSWSEQFSVNHNVMDVDHQRITQRIGYLYESMKTGHDKNILLPLVNDFIHSVEHHLFREEQYLKKINYQDFDIHKHQHTLFLAKINEFQCSFAQENQPFEMLPLLNDWVLKHIVETDMKYK